jgi:hypothetical protein
MPNAIWDIAQLERKLPDGDTCPDGAVKGCTISFSKN